MKEVVGEIRKGQLVSMFGVGSMIDLPHLSVLVRGLNQWSLAACKDILEPRLLSAVRAKIPTVTKIRACPDKSSDEPEYKKVDNSGVPVSIFPRWLRCPLCNVIADVDTGVFVQEFPPFQIDKIKFIHKGCTRQGVLADRNMPGAVPVRFLVACDKGHIDDFPWFEFCHRGQPCSKKPKNPKEGRVYRPGLILQDEGVTGEAAEVQVRCLECETFRPLADAFGSKPDLCLPGCAGKHLHLGKVDSCDSFPKAMLLGASNLYFPLNVSVLALPENHAHTDVDATVKQYWENLEKLTSKDQVEVILSTGLIAGLAGEDSEDVWLAIQRSRSEEPIRKLAELREEEYSLLAGLNPSVKSERLEAESVTALGGLAQWFEQVALVSRLTEFAALVGFTRIVAAGDLTDFDSVDPERLAPLMLPPTTWVPGSENRGEGIFLRFSESRLASWEGSKAVRKRMEKHKVALDAFLNERPWLRIELPPARYFLLHSVAHALMRELAISCGYSSTSLKERIYSRRPSDGVAPMAGILLYTASPDSEGTLGGLVSLGKPANLEPILDATLHRASVCSSDPICSLREVERESKLHGASCHACGFVAETSCERFNQFLDRCFIVDTLGVTGCGYFTADG